MAKEMKGYKFSDSKAGVAADKSFKSSGDAYGGITGIIAKLGTGGNVKGQANQKEKG
jgi:hypothetical protein